MYYLNTKKQLYAEMKKQVGYYDKWWPIFREVAKQFPIMQKVIDEDYYDLKKADLEQLFEAWARIVNKQFYKWCRETPNELKPWNM